MALLLVLPVLLYTAYAVFHVYSNKSAAFLSVKDPTHTDVIYIDSRKIGTTPLLDTSVPEGIHTISIKAAGYQTENFETNFFANTNSLLSINLGPSNIYTAYTLLTLQPSAKTGMYINDITDGTLTATFNGEKIQTNTFIQKSSGTYTLSLTAPGDMPDTETISIAHGYTLTIATHLMEEPI